MVSFFKKLFCEHKWKVHAKKEYRWDEKVDGTWDKVETVSKTYEILICEKCGKIKKIIY
tara:strand:+ start:1227 stop:1403 length:177 start_codon:yes stop_codon:yes gene_type:complete